MGHVKELEGFLNLQRTWIILWLDDPRHSGLAHLSHLGKGSATLKWKHDLKVFIRMFGVCLFCCLVHVFAKHWKRTRVWFGKLESVLWSQKRRLCGLLRKSPNDDEGHDVERLPIMGTTTALRPGELWQLLRQVARRSALLLRPSWLNQSEGRGEESANQRTGSGKLWLWSGCDRLRGGLLSRYTLHSRGGSPLPSDMV